MTGPVTSPVTALQQRFQARQQQVDARLNLLLPPETQRPEVLHKAMRHSIFAGGKRIRPILCLEAAAAVAPEFPEPIPEPIDMACALECLHTYSLIHDDLPALDNDDFRRGKPTCHKAFGEANAILAGDALMTIAYQIISKTETNGAARLVSEVAWATGTVDGMIGGQVLDLEWEGKSVDAETLEYIHRSKTGALLRASVRTGAIAAGADARTLEILSDYGRHVGLLFQIVDDILDVEGSSASLGKTAGKDATQKKATYPAVHGLHRAHELAAQTTEAALKSLEPLGERAHWLREIVHYLGARKS